MKPCSRFTKGRRALVVLASALTILHAQRDDNAVRYTRSVHQYAAPHVSLVDASGRVVKLDALIGSPGPVLLQFMFTTCTTICPILSATFSAVQSRLAPDVRLVSISIDPEHDTPARLAQFAAQFHAGRQWSFLTGTPQDILSVQRSFDADTNGKMNHRALTFLRVAAGEPWVRIEGLTSAAELLAEYRRAAR